MHALEGKTILITGASSGIGRATAIACAHAHATTVLVGRDSDRLAETLSMLNGDGHLTIAVDLTDTRQRSQLVDQLPRLDGIVHSAGRGHSLMAQFVTEEEIASVFQINFDAAVILQGDVMRKKKLAKGGSVVFISSIAMKHPWVGNALYSASKAALTAYADCLALELARRQTRVNCICPAMVDSNFHRVQGSLSLSDMEADKKNYPLGRYGAPDDVAAMAVFLLSDESSWVTGSHFDITGGFR